MNYGRLVSEHYSSRKSNLGIKPRRQEEKTIYRATERSRDRRRCRKAHFEDLPRCSKVDRERVPPSSGQERWQAQNRLYPV